MARKKSLTPRPLPLDGFIRGGPLNGWHYLFLRFVASPHALVLRATCVPPAWPFPHDINLDETLLGELVAGAPDRGVSREERQKYVPLEPEIEAAFTCAGIPQPPKDLIWSQMRPLRELLANINRQLQGATT